MSARQQYVGYDDIDEGNPRIISYDDNGVRTTTTTTKLGIDPNVKPKETVSVRKIQHPDSTETITVTEKKLPPVRYTETIVREKLPRNVAPPQIQITRPTPPNSSSSNGFATDVLRSIQIPPTPTTIYETPETVYSRPNTTTYNVIRRERVTDDPLILTPTRQDRLIVTPQTTTKRFLIRQTPEPTTTTIVREPTPLSSSDTIVQLQNPQSRIITMRQPTPPLTNTRTTTIINDNTHDTLIDDRRTLVNYQDDQYTTRQIGRRSNWCGDCGSDCDCFRDCFGTQNCCRTNSFARRKDVVSYETRVAKDGRRVRYRNADVPGYRCCNCCTGWLARVCPCCSCLEWFCACPCWLWLCCLLPLLLGLLGLSIGLLTQLPSINTSRQTYDELHVTESYNTVQAVLGQYAICQPDRNLPGTPLYCDQTTTIFSITAQASSSTVFAVAVNGSQHLDANTIMLLGLLVISYFLTHLFQLISHRLLHIF